VIVSFASTLGATLAFLASRFLLRDWVQDRFGDKLKPINDGVAREGAFYLFALRLVPAFPFFVINLVMGLTSIRTWTYYWVSQIGMFAGTVVYVYAGTQLGEFRISAGLLGAFALLGLAGHRLLPDWLAAGLWELTPGRYALLGLVAGLAFMLAELPNSFLKRQLGIPPGAIPRQRRGRVICMLLDRLDSVLGVLIVVSLLVPVTLATWVWLLLMGPGVHALFSTLLHRAGVKARAL